MSKIKKIDWVSSIDENNNYITNLESKYKTSSKLSINEIIGNTVETKSNDIFNFSVENESINNKMKEIITISEFSKFKDLDLLEKEALIIIFVNRFLLKNKLTEESKDFFIDLFKWIRNVSDYLTNKLNLNKISHSKRFKDEYLINRCSYKFCNYKDNCEFNYDKKGKKCNSDHYVHNMVEADSNSLIEYLVNNNLEKVDHHNEMMKCINTLMFVINHMYNELKNKIYYSSSKDENELHQNNNLSERIKTSARFESLKVGINNNDTVFKNVKFENYGKNLSAVWSGNSVDKLNNVSGSVNNVSVNSGGVNSGGVNNGSVNSGGVNNGSVGMRTGMRTGMRGEMRGEMRGGVNDGGAHKSFNGNKYNRQEGKVDFFRKKNNV